MRSEFNKLDQHIREHQLFSGNLLVAKNKEILYVGSFGASFDPSGNSVLDQDTIFELASVSKQFTAYTALKIFQNKNEKIDVDIRKYLTEFPYQGITLRNILNHTSGLPDYFGLFDKYWDKTEIATNNDVLELLSEISPAVHFRANENWEYSNTGYVIVASLIEKVGGVSFSQAMENEIFAPLNMTRSFIFNRRYEPRDISNYAFGVVQNEQTKELELPDNLTELNAVFYLDGIKGDGNVNSSITDILKWNNELIDKRSLDKRIVELATERTRTAFGNLHDSGMGWFINDDPELGKIIFHGGSWPGYSTYNSIYLDNGISIISLCNQPRNIETEQWIILALENIAFGKQFIYP